MFENIIKLFFFTFYNLDIVNGGRFVFQRPFVSATAFIIFSRSVDDR